MATREILDLEEMAAKFKTMPKPKTPLEARAYLNRALALQTKIDRLWNRSPKGSEEAEYGEMLADEFEPAFRAAEDIAEKMIGKTASRLLMASGKWEVGLYFESERDHKSFLDLARKLRLKVTDIGNGGGPALQREYRIEGDEAAARKFFLKEINDDPMEFENSRVASRLRRASGEDDVNIPGKHILGNAKVGGNAEVSDDAEVYDNAKVFGNARIGHHARVFDNAFVTDNAQLFDSALAYDNAKISGDASVFGKSTVRGKAKVTGHAKVYGDADVGASAFVGGGAEIYDRAKVFGTAQVSGKARIKGTAVILGGKWDGSEGPITSGTWNGPGIPA